MHLQLHYALQTYRLTRDFNPAEWIREKCFMLNDYMKACDLSAVVINISGGIDSAVTLGICIEAAKAPNSVIKRIIPVAQPIHSSSWALTRAQEVCAKFNQNLIVIDQTDLHTQLCDKIDTELKLTGNDYSRGNMRSYMRTPCIFYIAQLISQQGNKCIVIGTGNYDEDAYLGYFCKYGDGAVDLQLISDLHKSEVFTIGKYLEIPESIIQAEPSADLWVNQTDEAELGISYDFIELYAGWYLSLNSIRQQTFLDALTDQAHEQFFQWAKLANKINSANIHKTQGIVNI